MRTTIAMGVLLTTWASMGCQPAAPGGIGYEQAEQLCVIEGACMPDWFISSYGGFDDYCVTSFLGDGISSRYRDAFDCAARAGSDCEAVRACFGLVSQLEGANCDTTVSMCQGDSVVLCLPRDDGYYRPAQLAQRDCTAIGAHCIVSSAGYATCGDRSCSTEGSRCASSTSVTSCYDGVASDYDCREGEICREGSDGYASCVAAGDVCTRSTCDGDALLYCSYVDADVYRFAPPRDCAAAGQHCELVDGDARCVPEGFECDPAELTTSCRGNAIHYCGPDGRLHDYDCVEHGFVGCRTFGDVDYPNTVCVPHGIDLRL